MNFTHLNHKLFIVGILGSLFIIFLLFVLNNSHNMVGTNTSPGSLTPIQASNENKVAYPPTLAIFGESGTSIYSFSENQTGTAQPNGSSEIFWEWVAPTQGIVLFDTLRSDGDANIHAFQKINDESMMTSETVDLSPRNYWVEKVNAGEIYRISVKARGAPNDTVKLNWVTQSEVLPMYELTTSPEGTWEKKLGTHWNTSANILEGAFCRTQKCTYLGNNQVRIGSDIIFTEHTFSLSNPPGYVMTLSVSGPSRPYPNIIGGIELSTDNVNLYPKPSLIDVLTNIVEAESDLKEFTFLSEMQEFTSIDGCPRANQFVDRFGSFSIFSHANLSFACVRSLGNPATGQMYAAPTFSILITNLE
jgi:hypothetical protein